MKKRSTRFLSLLLSLLMLISVFPAGTMTAQAADSRVENAISWAVSVANNNYYGYSQNWSRRNGTPDFDCSSLVSWAFHNAGFSVQGGLNTRNMRNAFVNAGFAWIPASQIPGFPSRCDNLQRGDILLKEGVHTEIYIGSGKNVGAHADYNGIPGGTGGGKSWSSKMKKYRYGADEICIDPYYNGGWQGVLRYTKSTPPAPPAIPDKPTITGISATDIAVGKSVTITWNGSARATAYNVAVRGAEYRDLGTDANARSYTLTLSKVGTYTIYVEAKNQSGTSSNNNSRTCTAHANSTVKFVDWDGKELHTQSVRYGESATAPASPTRKGYTFQGWSDSFYNVTANRTIRANYKINTYTVNFLDKEKKVLKSEKVEYGKDATPPTDVNVPTGYIFVGWQSQDYKSVYTDATNKTINVQGIYEWKNKTLPIVCQITSAKRQSDGYYVYFDLTNTPNAITRGRAVVSLKTKTGKLVDATESAAFSIPKGGTKKGMEVFIPCDYAATTAEVIIVDSYSSGVPFSENMAATIDQGLMWSAWSGTKPSGTDLQIETRTEYRFRDKETKTGSSKTMDGWIWDGTKQTKLISQTGYQDSVMSTYDNETGKRALLSTQSVPIYSTRWKYVYYHFYKRGGGNHTFCPTNHAGGTYHGLYSNYSAFEWYKKSSCGSRDLYRGSACPECGSSAYWFYNSGDSGNETYQSGSKTQYNYGTYQYIYNFYRWKDWSDWTDASITATSAKQVETRTAYRYKSNSAGAENDSGKQYTIRKKVDASFAGKQITLYVYGYTGASDYTNEYIGQSVVGKDGSYSFSFKLRNEPTVETGDYTVAIGIEGTTNLIEVDKISAPKATHTVKFYDWDGTVISTQTVVDGANAAVPKNPTREGYDFVGWDKSTTNITEDTDFFSDFTKKQFTIVFVDWKNQSIKLQKFNYGDILTPPEAETVEGKTFSGWDQILKGNIIVKQDMVVTAQYETNTYTVKFYDFNNNVISTQKVAYGDCAKAPEDVNDSADGKQFAGWFNADEYEKVDHDIAVYPAYYFAETTPTPTANYESGEFKNRIQLTLTSSDQNAVIYYYLNGDESTEQIYTGPITVSKTCQISFYATSLGKNDSEESTKYYCINTSATPSAWMQKSALPTEVTAHPNDYTLESKTGYRYKDVKTVCKVADQNTLKSNGWSLSKTTYSDYTAWQDSPIAKDTRYIGFEVATRKVEDPTVTHYKYTHYKYTDASGTVQYAPKKVSGYSCTLETVVCDSRLTVAGFLDDNTSYYVHNGQRWFNQTKISGEKTQYRSRYQNAEYYKWTAWTVNAPVASETREKQTTTLYRYANKNYHIVTVNTGFGDAPFVSLVQDGQAYDASKIAVDGYTLEGLYKDAECKTKFALNTKITRSWNLYANYTAKKYKVVFQMQDGTELDTQQVEYMGAATEPATDSVPGYVFSGWDRDFDCITEDTVVTGKYFKTAEYARIALDQTNASMFTNTSMRLNVTITPANLASETVIWTSSNPGVASVDDAGNVLALSEGETTITAMVEKTKEKATCRIAVKANLGTTIALKDNAKLNYDSAGFVRRVAIKSTVASVQQEFANSGLQFESINGISLKSTDYVGTGTVIRLGNTDKRTVVVTGDMNGDGLINNRDVAAMNKYLLSKITAKECQMLAMDVNGDGKINNKDAAMVARYLVGKETL